MVDTGKKTLFFSLGTLTVLFIFHFIYFGVVGIDIMKGLVAGLISAVGLAIMSGVVVLVLNLVSKARERLGTGYMFVFSVLILSNLLGKIYVATIAPMLIQFGI